jgi:hypothetical protein
MRTLRSLVLVFLLATGGCQLLGEFVVAGIEAAVHEIDHDHGPPPRRRPAGRRACWTEPATASARGG